MWSWAVWTRIHGLGAVELGDKGLRLYHAWEWARAMRMGAHSMGKCDGPVRMATSPMSGTGGLAAEGRGDAAMSVGTMHCHSVLMIRGVP